MVNYDKNNFYNIDNDNNNNNNNNNNIIINNNNINNILMVIDLFKVRNRNPRTRCEVCSKFRIKTSERRHDFVLMSLS